MKKLQWRLASLAICAEKMTPNIGFQENCQFYFAEHWRKLAKIDKNWRN
jgi:hypothetical protein